MGRWGAIAEHVAAELRDEFRVLLRRRWLGVFAFMLALQRREAVEEQLADDVGLGDGIAAVNAFVSDLLERFPR